LLTKLSQIDGTFSLTKKPKHPGELKMPVQKMSLTQEPCNALEKCPFLDFDRGYCSAAMLRFMPESRQLYHYCCNDDHDDCPVFLAKALRSSASGGYTRDLAVCCEK
jgi:hypothetical protein